MMLAIRDHIGLTTLPALLLWVASAAIASPVLPPQAPTLDPPAITAVGPRPKAGVTAASPYNHGDPTAQEQYMLELVNRARANPTTEGLRLQTTTDPDVVNAYSYFSVDVYKLAADFAGYPARPPLAFNAKLIAAARGHSQDMAANNFQGHTGSNGSTLTSRISAAGYSGWTSIAENVFAYTESVFHGHAALNVDWGVPSLGHRQNLMNFSTTGPVYTEIGIGIVAESSQSTNVGPLVLTQDFGRREGQFFVVGVVYRDDNHDGFYSVGEGLGGVTVSTSQGNYAYTANAGGYVVPLDSTSGTITVRAEGGALGTAQERSIQLAGVNVKVDFVATASNSQDISFAALADRTLGSAPFAVSAQASSGLAVTFTSRTTSVCTVSGSTVTLVATGTCTIRASQAGNAQWAAATPVDRSFSVSSSPTPAPPAVITGSASGVSTTGASLTGTASSNGTSTTVTFQYGQTTSYGSSATAAQSPLIAGAAGAAVSASVAGLACGTTYHYRVVGSNAGGTAYGADSTFATAPCSGDDDFPPGGQFPGGWSQPATANAGWLVTSSSSHRGPLSLRSASIGSNQIAAIKVSGSFAAGQIAFAVRVSSERSYDYYEFYIDGTLVDYGSGEVAWTPRTFSVGAGAHTFIWAYVKDESFSEGADAAWIDSVVLPPVVTSAYSRSYVQKAYVAYYGRPADPAGQTYWAARMDAENRSLDAIISAFGNSDEFNRRYGGLGPSALVTKIYQQALGRNPDEAGLNWYVQALYAGRRTLQSITLDVLNGATTAPDSTVVANKLEVAEYYTAKVASGCAYGSEQDGVAVISSVTASSATVASAKSAIDARCGS